MSHRQIILDVDPGVDDMAAMLLALASAELDVLGVCVGAGNIPREQALENAHRTLALAGRADIPLLVGCERPLVRDQVFGRHVDQGVFADTLVPPADTLQTDGSAVEFIVGAARAAAAGGDPITVCASGPLSAVALALSLGDDVRRGISEITVMGGAFKALGNRVPWAEFNMLADPHAAAIVLASDVPVTLFPLDVTLEVLLTDTHLAGLRSSGSRVSAAFADVFEGAGRCDPERYGRPGGPVHDALPIAYLLAPELFSVTNAPLGIICEGPQMGHTFADFWSQGTSKGTRIAQSVDEQGVLNLICSRIANPEATPIAQNGRRSS